MSQTPPGTQDGWKIPSAAERCSACESELPPGSSVTVVLSLDAEGPARLDLCEACEAPETSGGIFWKHKVPDRGDGRPVVDYAMLREMFGRLVEREEEAYRRLAYLVALVLVRKRHLRLLGFEARGGKEVMRVSKGAGTEPVEVPAPYLSAEDMIETREMLTRLLAADLPEDGLLPIPQRPAAAEGGAEEDGAEEPEAGDEPAQGLEVAEAAESEAPEPDAPNDGSAEKAAEPEAPNEASAEEATEAEREG